MRKLREAEGRRTHICFRCDSTFAPYYCPRCGSGRVDGSAGMSGARFRTPRTTVRCWDCEATIPAPKHPRGN
ncbi:hypothetical protein [Kitasatospora purpeofusca]|uniref:hypothetical protein n=1 Tax=Kitasatospora purpeofusca TaxID=67352 RepID=UPI0036D2E853